MRSFTKMFSALLCMFVLSNANVNAQEDEVLDFDGSFYHSWSEVSATATDNGEGGGGVVLGTEVDLGGTIWGNLSGAVPYLYYANITEYSELRFEGTPGATIRIMCNRVVDEGPIYEIKPTIGEDGKLTVAISDLKYLSGGTPCDFVCLQSIKVPASWAGGTMAATITSIKIVKPGDPLSVPKDDLKKAISLAKLQSAVGKTSDSWEALQQAIADAEAALATAASAESLQQAKENVEKAIADLAFAEGYSNLTKDMFLKYASVEEPGEGEVVNSAYDLFTASDLPYGDGNVGELLWADLTQFDKLIVSVVGTTKPRFCLNRLVAGGQQAATMEDSKMLDINPNNDFLWSTEKYLTVEDGVYTLDLKKIVADYGFARLHCIKKQGWGAGVTVTGMYLYKEETVEPVKPEYGVIWTGNEVFGVDGGNIALATNLFKGLVKENDIIRVSLSPMPEIAGARGAFRNIKPNSKVELWPSLEEGAQPFDSWTMKGQLEENLVQDFVIDADALAIITDEARENIYVKGICVTITEIELVKHVTDGINQLKSVNASNAIYNLNGQQVIKANKGLYIIGGKKVLVK